MQPTADEIDQMIAGGSAARIPAYGEVGDDHAFERKRPWWVRLLEWIEQF